ncbi:CD225/dispanin family protein [Spiractinospora alimapuensis]|uniref:CD225/dispanin family protein n=1 Tax=Spiractinospora alimapuensis TaxID=2820884 RepID=UPI001F338234|nr:CD225/dispanin family protein [Spiractinospora alimapuensis]QVQ53092.1 CD225/dispanin family protein [Spiractinospora alimapuensis]
MSYGPPPGGYGPPGGVTGGHPGMRPPPGEPPKTYTWMNVLGIFGCTILGVIGLVFSLQVNSKWQMGDYAGAQSASDTARILGIISLICFIVMVLFWIVYIGIFVLYFGFAFMAYSTY